MERTAFAGSSGDTGQPDQNEKRSWMSEGKESPSGTRSANRGVARNLIVPIRPMIGNESHL
jgi:hypothetical protein